MATPVEAAYAESNKMLRKENAKLLKFVPGGGAIFADAEKSKS